MMLVAMNGMGSNAHAATLVATTYSRIGTTPAQLQFNSDGFAYANTTGSLVQQYQWLTGSGTASDYEVRSTVTGGSPGSFTTDPSAGTWLALSTSRTWERASTASFDRNVIATYEIRDASTLTVLATASITLDCDMS